jgi:hypothetical protein|tara:strand:- start:60 stop:371 length:312 start_codon:yes stop_codon:yes gene_type:complete
MPFTRQLVLTQTVIGLVSQASGIDEEAVFTHLSLSEQGVTSIHQHVVIMILINTEFGLSLNYQPEFKHFSIEDWVEKITSYEASEGAVVSLSKKAHRESPGAA